MADFYQTQGKRIPDMAGCPEIFSRSLQFFFRKYAIFTVMLGGVEGFIGSLADSGDGICLLKTADANTDGHRQRRAVRQIIEIIAGCGNGFADVFGPFNRIF